MHTVNTTWQAGMGYVKECFKFLIYNWSANQRNNFTSGVLEQGKTFKSNRFGPARLTMSMVNGFSVPLFLNHGNDTVSETVVTVKSWGMCLAMCLIVCLVNQQISLRVYDLLCLSSEWKL